MNGLAPFFGFLFLISCTVFIFLLLVRRNKRAGQRLRESEELLRQVLENIHEIFWMSSVDGKKIIYVSPAYEQITGRSCESLYASPASWMESIHPEDRKRVGEAVEKAVDYKYDEEYRILKPDGSIHWVWDRSFPVHDEKGAVYRVAGITEDTTERKEMEEGLRKLNEALRQKKIELEAANKDLESFSYSVSHDLRSPLGVIGGFSQMLLEKFSNQWDGEAKKLLKFIWENTQKMEQLIADILTFSQSTRKLIQKSEIDMKGLIETVFKEIKMGIPKRRIEFRMGELPKTFGDASLIRQVVVNLLSNAVKYSRQKEAAIIEVDCKDEAGQSVYYVKDNGAGFDMRHVDRLFGTFQRLHSANEFEGTGVGLAIVKRVIERHGGRVWADSKVGEGATFYFTLPKEQV